MLPPMRTHHVVDEDIHAILGIFLRGQQRKETIQKRRGVFDMQRDVNHRKVTVLQDKRHTYATRL